MLPQQKSTALSAIISLAAATLVSQTLRRTATAANNRKPTNRSNQAELFADEEALLHEQLMIEQDILLRQARDSKRQPKPITSGGRERPKPALQTLQKNQAAIVQLRIRQTERRLNISHKLEMIRHRIAPRKVDNSAGIANLRAAIAA